MLTDRFQEPINALINFLNYRRVASEAFIGILLTTMVIIPLENALLAAYSSARDPMHRVIPHRGPWFFFLRTARHRIRDWPCLWLTVWTAFLCVHVQLPVDYFWYIHAVPGTKWLAYIWSFIWYSDGCGWTAPFIDDFDGHGLGLFYADGVMLLFAWMANSLAACLFLVPRCSTRWRLTISALASVLGTQVVVRVISALIFIDNWERLNEVTFIVPRQPFIGPQPYMLIPVPHFATAAGAACILLFVLVNMLSNPNRWFRLDHE